MRTSPPLMKDLRRAEFNFGTKDGSQKWDREKRVEPVTHREGLGDARGDFPGVRLPMGLVPMLPLRSGTLRLDRRSAAAPGTLMAPLVLLPAPAAAKESGLFLLVLRISGVTARGLEEPLSTLPRRSSGW